MRAHWECGGRPAVQSYVIISRSLETSSLQNQWLANETYALSRWFYSNSRRNSLSRWYDGNVRGSRTSIWGKHNREDAIQIRAPIESNRIEYYYYSIRTNSGVIRFDSQKIEFWSHDYTRPNKVTAKLLIVRNCVRWLWAGKYSLSGAKASILVQLPTTPLIINLKTSI
jgi:hypothetical protein